MAGTSEASSEWSTFYCYGRTRTVPKPPSSISSPSAASAVRTGRRSSLVSTILTSSPLIPDSEATSASLPPSQLFLFTGHQDRYPATPHSGDDESVGRIEFELDNDIRRPRRMVVADSESKRYRPLPTDVIAPYAGDRLILFVLGRRESNAANVSKLIARMIFCRENFSIISRALDNLHAGKKPTCLSNESPSKVFKFANPGQSGTPRVYEMILQLRIGRINDGVCGSRLDRDVNHSISCCSRVHQVESLHCTDSRSEKSERNTFNECLLANGAAVRLPAPSISVG
ncbi:hypothetical protein LshimejAT787_0404110 [Lyophyllum shimeji]|uniref:Uncharacterized protein n=1 Tax=Lyophyllum shimeji TaxID=47721 RepID=A0A9P3UN18_LYOSH|nr:hypothetical protein LshimejAT787_0404110 [Lyophyllum shimeji]